MNNDLVSVLMPAYNVSGYIAAAIKSILAQSYPNWELIISDDGSTDDTCHIAAQFSTSDQRIRVYRQESNLGFVGNKNFLLGKARGEYIIFHDSDDISDPDLLQVTISNMQCYQTNLSVAGYYLIRGLNTQPPGERKIITPIRNQSLIEAPLRRYPFMFANIMFRKSVVKQFGNFNTYFNGVFGEDYYWLLKVHEQNPIVYDPKPLYGYRYHASSTTNFLNNKRKLIMNEILDTLFEQRLKTGSDWLEQARFQDLRNLESALLKDKALMAEKYRTWAAKAVDKSDMPQALSLLKKAFVLRPLRMLNYKTLFYFLRTAFGGLAGKR